MHEESFGIIPLRKTGETWEVLMVQPLEGWWGLPKGHAEAGETPLQAAEREFQEETGLTVVTIHSLEPLTESYVFTKEGTDIKKTVHYFPAAVEGNLMLQAEEIQDAFWVPLEEASQVATYPQMRALLKEIHPENYG